jgi:diguanylate cyclase (GGDEF)-like protein/PAS domain S-box-containing protein
MRNRVREDDPTERKPPRKVSRKARDDMKTPVPKGRTGQATANDRLQRKATGRGANGTPRWRERESAAVLDTMSELVVYQDTEMRLVWANRAAAEAVGLTAEQLTGRHCYEIWHQRSEPCAGCPVVKARETGQPQTGEVASADGKVWFIQARPLLDANGNLQGIVEVTSGITERREAEAALRASEQRLRAVVTNAPVILFTVDRDGVFTLSEGRGLEALGLKPGEVVGLSIFDVFADIPNIGEELSRALAGEAFTTTAKVAGITFETYCAPLRDHTGDVCGLIGVATDISERTRVEKALRESEQRYRALVETSPDAITVTGLDMNIIMVNQQAALLYGFDSVAEVLSSGRKALDFIAPDDRQHAIENAQKTLETGVARNGEYSLLRKDGSPFPGEVAASLIRDAEGNPKGFLAVVRDISERKRAEKALRESEAKYRQIFENVQDIFYRTNIQGTIVEISPSVERYGYSREGLVGTSVLEIYERPEERAALVQELLEHGEVVDYEMRLRTGDGRTIDASVSAHLLRGPDGTPVWFDGSIRDITERKQAEKALRESEAKYRHIFENVQDIFYRTDAQGIITEISPAMERYGYTREELIGTQVLDVYEDPEERSTLLQVLFERGEVLDYEVRLKARDGRVIPTSVSTRLLRDPDGAFLGVEGTLRDVGERKRMEQALARQTALVRAMSRVFEEALTCESEEAVAHTCLSVAEQLTGSKFGFIGEVNQAGRFDTIAMSDPGWHACRMPKSHAVLKINDMEIRGIWGKVIKDGRPLIVNDPASHLARVGPPDGHPPITAFLGAPLRDDGKTIGMIALANKESGYDLADQEDLESLSVAFVEALKRKRAEVALRESEAKYRHVFENVQDIIYRTDAQGIITEISPSVEQWGYTRTGMIGAQVLDVYEDPEERSRLLEALFKRGEVVDYEVHLRTGDGRVVPTSVNTRLLRDADGTFVGVEGSLRNISERKRMEEALRESVAKYRSIFENVQDVYYRTNVQGTIIEMSPSVERYGYVHEKLIGRSVLDLYERPEDRAGLVKAMLERGEVIDYELRLKTSDGRPIAMSVSGRLLRGPDGAPLGFEGFLRDITERKRMEEALRDQLRRDALTGVLNHGAIVDELRSLISSGANNGSHAVAMVDVDGLKATNDTFGHQLGDAVLVAVASALSQNGALVGRYGGDEFVAVMPGADRPAAERYREQVLGGLAKASLRDPESGASVPVEASIGIAIYPTETTRIEELIKRADTEMLAAKRQRSAAVARLTSSRALGGGRTAEIVGGLVPLLTSAGDLDSKLRLVAHRLSVEADYEGVTFSLFGELGAPPSAQNTFAQAPEEMVEAWRRDNRSQALHPIRPALEARRRPIILGNPHKSGLLRPEEREILRAAGFRSAMVAPMIWEGEVVGLLGVASKRKAAFGPRDAEFLMAVATQVTAIARTSTLVDELQSTSTRLAEAQTETVVLLAAAAEAHDQTTGLHLQNVRVITEALAHELGHCENASSELGLAAVLHDIGKIRVPDVVLSTAGQLTDAEWELMQQHTVWGSEFLAGRPGFEMAATIARSHHERWDGGGYPDGLKGEAIPEAAAIVAVADAFDAMTSDRPYRAARSVADAVQEILACSGTHFNPKVAKALRQLYKSKRLPRLHRPTLDEAAA